MKPTFNLEMLNERTREVKGSIEKIRSYTAVPDKDFFADERNLYTIEHLLLICVESVATICSHLMAKLARKSSASYGECFQGLQELGILDDELLERLIRMARFRNLLVHRYWEVDSKRILQYARENLGDFEAFLEQVGKFVGQSGE